MTSGKYMYLTLSKTTHLPGQEQVTVVASLPTNQSREVTANIPILFSSLLHEFRETRNHQKQTYILFWPKFLTLHSHAICHDLTMSKIFLVSFVINTWENWS